MKIIEVGGVITDATQLVLMLRRKTGYVCRSWFANMSVWAEPETPAHLYLATDSNHTHNIHLEFDQIGQTSGLHPPRTDSQPRLVFLQPTLAAPVGLMTECQFFGIL